MPPAPAGELQEQVRAQYAYLFQLAQQLNLALDRVDVSVPAAQQARQSAASVGAELTESYDRLKSLIVKTAAVVRQEMETLRAELAGEYMALSDFGSYVERLNAVIEADPSALTQYYDYFSELRADVEAVSAGFTAWRTAVEGSIRTGIVDYDGATPVYGMAVGQNLVTSVDSDSGDTIIEKKNFRAVYAANRLSFWQDGVEVAYVSNNQLYITDVVALQNLSVGPWRVSAGADGLAVKWIGG